MFSRSASSTIACDQWLIEQALDQIAPVRDVRADHRGLQVAKVHAQDALGHAHGALVAFVVLDQFAQVDRRGELHAGLAPQNDDAQQPAQAPGDGPAVGEQQLPRTGFAVRRLAPEHADRNDLRVFGVLVRALTRRVRVGGAPRLSWRPSQSGSGVR
jgi:hypothetical protein